MTAQPLDDSKAIPVPRSPWMPPFFLLLFGMLGGALHLAVGGPLLLHLPWLGAALAAAGFGVMLWAALLFGAAGATLKPFERSRVLVASGPFRFTRNPMYLGMAAMLVGAALALGTPAPWLAALAFPVLIQQRFIRHEERALANSLGEPYEEYRRRVRRWI